MNEVIINYAHIVEIIGEQLQVVWDALKETNPDLIGAVKGIEVSDEQSFNKKQDEQKLEQGFVYIVVRFGAGSINYGSSVTPISLYVLGTANKVKPTQLLLSVFASSWTTKNLGQDLEVVDNSMLQVWNTPEVVTNFNEIYADFRNLFRLTGNIVVGPAAVRVGELTYYYDEYNTQTSAWVEKEEKVSIMSFSDGFRSSLDTQPFGNTFGFAQSEVNFSTYTFAISTYLLDNHLSALILSMRGFRNRSGSGIGAISAQNYFKGEPNDKVKIKIKFTNGFDNVPGTNESATTYDPLLGSTLFDYFKIVDSQIGQEIAGIPTLSITFAR